MGATAGVLLLMGCGGSNSDNDASGTTAQEPVETAEPVETRAADTQPATTGLALAANQHQVGDLVLTVHEQVDPAPTETFDPEPGTRWIAFDVEYTNPTTEPVFVSTYGTMEMALSDNRRTDPELIGINDESPVEGEIPPNTSLRGWVTFAVPDDVNPERLRVATADNSGDPIEISL